MVGNEGFGRGSPCNHVHERRLHLQETQVVQKLPDVGDDLGSGDELVPHALVDDEVQVSLPEPGLLVLQPVVEVWEHVQAGGQEGDGARDDAELSLLGFAWEGAVATSMQPQSPINMLNPRVSVKPGFPVTPIMSPLLSRPWTASKSS